MMDTLHQRTPASERQSEQFGESPHRKARIQRFHARHLSKKALARKKSRRKMVRASRRRNAA